jgi:hypothetical protein
VQDAPEAESAMLKVLKSKTTKPLFGIAVVGVNVITVFMSSLVGTISPYVISIPERAPRMDVTTMLLLILESFLSKMTIPEVKVYTLSIAYVPAVECVTLARVITTAALAVTDVLSVTSRT